MKFNKLLAKKEQLLTKIWAEFCQELSGAVAEYWMNRTTDAKLERTTTFLEVKSSLPAYYEALAERQQKKSKED